MSLPGDVHKRRIFVLRDTGAAQSILLEGTLPLSDATYTGRNVLLRGVEMGELTVSLHTKQLETVFTTGSVVVGVQPALPIEGIALLMGNDLAGGKIVYSTDTPRSRP